ncbi:ThuA domain-containing protein [Porifericola rhodea]|uniref:PVC-type heme-binding CxxCH protein n=1 Tax=Porifericola rhodea TaxID=930972 RepID=UPI00266630C9|nr:PVC-type heme-binding CxxCH protein [Porifericola rhodea]WKN31478.1 ThuA domain-containing protein [Porifericola rhodea]
MKTINYWYILLFSFTLLACSQEKKSADNNPKPIEILFLGHDSEHHNSEAYMPLLSSALFQSGINFTYTEDLNDLNAEKLSYYDGLLLYANHETISAAQEKALMNFVEGGKAFIPVHCASYCFHNSDKFIDMVGAQFLKHETGTFVANIINGEHAAIEGVEEFSVWDETYVHHKHNDDRVVLMERKGKDGEAEPWTWVREQGKGKVFYTAYGHDERVWSHPEFHKLIEKGILWAVDDQTKEKWQAYVQDMPQLQYVDKDSIPNYEKRDPAPRYQLPLSPEESKKLIQVPPEFELELFAAEPDIINPIAMDWDEKGRLWVIETVDYPNTVRNDNGKGDDRIKICEDTDGDGKADKFTIFADQLNIPTSLVFSQGGIIVSQVPNFLFLKDTDGDDKADVREVIMEGWGTFDTHAGPSNLRYGVDNNIWGVVGYSGFKGRIANQEFEFGQGVYRFTPDLEKFEYITRTSNNTWGLGFTENFDVFASTANNTHSVYVGIPNSYYEGVEGLSLQGSSKIDGHYAMQTLTPNIRQVDVWGGYTAASGHSFYTARSFPRNYWSRAALVCEPTGNILHTAIIEKQGAGFIEKNGGNLMASADEWVSPVEAKVGPDGAVWVADWYNFIVQHNPTPTPDRGGYEAETGDGNAYVNPLRDRKHGRIWRIVYKDAEPYSKLQLDAEDNEQLLEALTHDNMFWRLTAQRLLVEKGNKEVLPDLYQILSDRTTDDLGMNTAALHALWTIHGLGALENEEAYDHVVKALKHPAAGVRRAAMQILPSEPWSKEAILRADLLNDEEPTNQLAATLNLAHYAPSNGLGATLYSRAQDNTIQQDNWLAQATYLAAGKHREGFISAFIEDNPSYSDAAVQDMMTPTRESPDFKDTSWKSMALPTLIEDAGLDIDGIIWFRKTISIPSSAVSNKAIISLGAVDDTDEVWINGIRVGGIKNDYQAPRSYTIPDGVLKAGNNLVVVRVEDYQGGGGFSGTQDEMHIKAKNSLISLAGDWKYQVEKEFNSVKLPFSEQGLAAFFMDNYWNKPITKPNTDEGVEMADVQVIHIKTVKNAMKYDVSEFVVEAGKPVKIVFDNPDFMQHNLLIIQPGTLEKVGKAADKMATDPNGAEKNYVPDMIEVLFSTPLIDPEASAELIFQAPQKAGEYPFVCTFPGHWRIMQGIMKVVSSSPA